MTYERRLRRALLDIAARLDAICFEKERLGLNEDGPNGALRARHLAALRSLARQALDEAKMGHVDRKKR